MFPNRVCLFNMSPNASVSKSASESSRPPAAPTSESSYQVQSRVSNAMRHATASPIRDLASLSMATHNTQDNTAKLHHQKTNDFTNTRSPKTTLCNVLVGPGIPNGHHAFTHRCSTRARRPVTNAADVTDVSVSLPSIANHEASH